MFTTVRKHSDGPASFLPYMTARRGGQFENNQINFPVTSAPNTVNGSSRKALTYSHLVDTSWRIDILRIITYRCSKVPVKGR